MLQSIESQGIVDYSLGGHSCVRPPQVQQGKASDHFEIKAEQDNPLLWRPQGVQAKNLKGANIASHFTYAQLKDSPLLLAPWFKNTRFE